MAEYEAQQKVDKANFEPVICEAIKATTVKPSTPDA
jgi:hypothetical protein